MNDREHYARLLGLQAPWLVKRIEITQAERITHVWLKGEPGAGDQPCPGDPRRCPVYDHRDREWRHLDTMRFETRLHASVPVRVTGQVAPNATSSLTSLTTHPAAGRTRLKGGDDRRQAMLELVWAMGLNDRQREGLEAIGMDMWEPQIIEATLARLPGAERMIVFEEGTAVNLWTYRWEHTARTYFRRWYFWATHSRLQPMIQ